MTRNIITAAQARQRMIYGLKKTEKNSFARRRESPLMEAILLQLLGVICLLINNKFMEKYYG